MEIGNEVKSHPIETETAVETGIGDMSKCCESIISDLT